MTTHSFTAKATDTVTGELATLSASFTVIDRVAKLIGFDCAKGDWSSTNALIGPGDTNRLFYNSTTPLPATFDPVGAPSGKTVITSFKTTTNLVSYLQSIPSDRNVIMCFHHEPEGDFASGSDFVSQFKSASDTVQTNKLGSNVRMAMIAGSYLYGGTRNTDVSAGNYLRGLGNISPVSGKPYAELFTVDVYQGDGYPSTLYAWPTNGLANYDQFQTWLSLVSDPSIVGTVLPVGITEYGINYANVGASLFQQRLSADRDYLRATFNGDLEMWCYWYHSNDVPAQFTDPDSIALWQSIETG